MTLNGSGVRDTGRALKISKDTVCSALKKTPKINTYFMTYRDLYSFRQLDVKIGFSAEMDEFRSFVQSKGNQRWTRYAIERRAGVILAWHNGKRQDKDFLTLWKLLKAFSISKYHTDDWGTSCFSKNEQTHDKVIGMYIEKYITKRERMETICHDNL
jgi:IS1 family transposase